MGTSYSSGEGSLRVDPREIATSGDMGPAGVRALKYYRRCLCVKEKACLMEGRFSPMISGAQLWDCRPRLPHIFRHPPEGYMMCS